MAILVAFALVIGSNLLSIRSAAGEARSELSQSVSALTRSETEAALQHVATARERMDEAQARSRRFDVRIARTLPWVGSDVRAVTATVEAASDVTSAVERIASHLASPHQPVYARGHVDGEAAAQMAAVWQEAASLLADARHRMQALPEARLAEIRAAAREVAERAEQGSVTAEAVVAVLEDVGAAGRGEEPFRALVVFSNGAELRALGGVPVFLAELEVADGELQLAELAPTPRSHPPSAAALSEDFQAMFGSFVPSRLWSNVTLSADGPAVGETAANMYEAVSGRRPDLVVLTDLVATGYLLEGFSGLDVDGHAFDPSGLATDFLVETYQMFQTGREQNEYLVQVIEQAFFQLLVSEPSGSSLLGGVRRAVEEGRLGAWSSDPAVQEGLSLAGADLAVGDEEDQVDVAVQNFSASKLDIHTSLQPRLDLEILGCAVLARLEVGVTESAPSRLVETLRFRAEENRWWVNAYLPPDASLRSLQSNGEAAGGGEDRWGDRPVASVFVRAPFGGTGTAGFEWIQPIPDSGTLTVRTNPTVSEPAGEMTVSVPPAPGCDPAR